jgi:hypothetical protein
MDLAILSKSFSWVSAPAGLAFSQLFILGIAWPAVQLIYPSGHSRAYRSGSDGKTVVGVAFLRYRHFFELNSPDSAL